MVAGVGVAHKLLTKKEKENNLESKKKNAIWFLERQKCQNVDRHSRLV